MVWRHLKANLAHPRAILRFPGSQADFIGNDESLVCQNVDSQEACVDSLLNQPDGKPTIKTFTRPPPEVPLAY
jgi:hypothetical protein